MKNGAGTVFFGFFPAAALGSPRGILKNPFSRASSPFSPFFSGFFRLAVFLPNFPGAIFLFGGGLLVSVFLNTKRPGVSDPNL